MNGIVVLAFTLLVCVSAEDDVFMERLLAKMRRQGETEMGDDLLVLDHATRGAPEDFVKAHNDARHRASPHPTDEPDMQWDADLASLAQSYADQCIWGHNAARSKGTIKSKFPYVGENLFISTYQDVSPGAAVEAWEGEKRDYTFATMKCTPGKMCGHYTQVVWHDSTHVGCGTKSCPTVKNSSFKDATLIVCNYGPGGNFRGEHPYEV